MKKLWILLIACVALCAGCSSGLTEWDGLDTPVVGANGETLSNRVISPEQAKAFAQKAMMAIQEQGKTLFADEEDASVLRVVEDVMAIKTEDGVTALYVVNFASQRGFMVLNADKESKSPIVSFDTERSFNVDEIQEGSTVWAWLETEKEKNSENIRSGVHPEHQGYQFWEYIVSTDEGESSVELRNVGDAEPTTTNGPELRGTHKESSGRSTIQPYYNVRYNLWGQGTGYNADALIAGTPAGCPAVAIGLLCKTKNYPSDYSYANMPTSLNTSSSNAISRMFRSIGDKIPDYQWNTNASGATPNNILIGVKALGYTHAKIKVYDAWTAYSEIKNRRPVLLVGYMGVSGGQLYNGHIWIADGYFEQTWIYTKKKKFLGITISTETWEEYMDLFYMNWGWNGNGNGWVDQENWNSSVNGSYNTERRLFYDLY